MRIEFTFFFTVLAAYIFNFVLLTMAPIGIITRVLIPIERGALVTSPIARRPRAVAVDTAALSAQAS